MRDLIKDLLLPLTVISFAVLPACSKPTGPSTGTIVVTVVDEAANPLAEVVLTLTPGDIVRTTDSEGIATFSGVEVGDYSIRACLSDYDDCEASVIVVAGQTTEKTITMSMDTGDLVFIVLDEDSLAVAGATVTIQPGDESRTTGMDARALFENCTIGSYSYSIQGSGFDDITGTVEVQADETVTETVRIPFMKGVISVYVRESFVDTVVANVWLKVERTDGVPTIDAKTDETGCWVSAPTRVGTATVKVPPVLMLEGAQSEVEIYGEQTTHVVLRMNRTKSRLAGEFTLAPGAPLTLYDHDIGLYKYVEADDSFSLLDNTTSRQYYSFTTAEKGILAVVLWSTYTASEFNLCWSPFVDTRSGHLKIDLPTLENVVSCPYPEGSFGPLTFPKTLLCYYPVDGAVLEIWSIYVLEWNYSTNEWDWELSWYKEDTDIDEQVTWDGVFNEGSYTGQQAFYDDDDHWYAWDLAILYNDGRFSVTFPYTFSFFSDSALVRTLVGRDRKSPAILNTIPADVLPRRIIRP